MHKRIAIIPARGGSKRILRKNIREFLGKPIIAYSIEAALKSDLFDEVIVSTDDKEIEEIAIKYGAKVPFIRSDENSGDHATTADVIIEVLEWYEKQGVNYEEMACIYPCSPFITQDLLKDSKLILNKNNADCVFPIIKYNHPIRRAVSINSEGKMKSLFDEFSTTRTQDLDLYYHDAGMFYFLNIEKFQKTKSLRTENTYTIEINNNLSQDIDNESDWKLAEMKYAINFSYRIK